MLQEKVKERRRILFIGEAVTLAHVARPLVLAGTLPASAFDVTIATDPSAQKLIESSGFAYRSLCSVGGQAFLRALASGAPVFDYFTLKSYVENDLALIGELKPDLVIGDFRLSLSISARVSHVPYMAIGNAHWSPHARVHIPVPELPMTRLLGPQVAQLLFTLARPAAFAWHCLPLNRLRRHYGLPSIGYDLRCIYSDGDYLALADVPSLSVTQTLREHQRFVGPLVWSPPIPFPEWWGETDSAGDPFVYVTFGSSGRVELLDAVLAACAELPIRVMVSTAGRAQVANVSGRVFVADYLPGDQAAARAKVVICNGGSAPICQALSAGTPVLGVPSNLDQHLYMQAVQAAGAGCGVRSEWACRDRLRAMLAAMLDGSGYTNAAARIRQEMAQWHASELFPAWVEEILSTTFPREPVTQ